MRLAVGVAGHAVARRPARVADRQGARDQHGDAAHRVVDHALRAQLAHLRQGRRVEAGRGRHHEHEVEPGLAAEPRDHRDDDEDQAEDVDEEERVHGRHHHHDEDRAGDGGDDSHDGGPERLGRADRREDQDRGDEEGATDHLRVVEHVERRHRHEGGDHHRVGDGLALRVREAVRASSACASPAGRCRAEGSPPTKNDQGHPQQVGRVEAIHRAGAVPRRRVDERPGEHHRDEQAGPLQAHAATGGSASGTGSPSERGARHRRHGRPRSPAARGRP